MIERDLLSFLVGALADVNVFFSEAPPDEDEQVDYPIVVFHLESRDRGRPRRGGLVYHEFEFNCYHYSADRAVILGNQVTDLLEGFTGDLGRFYITLCWVDNEYDTRERASNSFCRTFTLHINHK